MSKIAARTAAVRLKLYKNALQRLELQSTYALALENIFVRCRRFQLRIAGKLWDKSSSRNTLQHNILNNAYRSKARLCAGVAFRRSGVRLSC